MRILVFGANGATGKLVVSQLVSKNISVRIVIRPTAIIPNEISENKNVEIVRGNIHEFSMDQVSALINDCDAAVSCLGHNLTFKGIFGKPHQLVFNIVKKITDVWSAAQNKKKFVLMSTTGYTNKAHGEKETFGENVVFSLLKLLLPPHTDNVNSGDYLFGRVKDSKQLEWVAVRPDSLIDEERVSEYEIVDTRKRSPIFDAGKTSRINVAHFMVELLTNDTLWDAWKYKAPVLYNKSI